MQMQRFQRRPSGQLCECTIWMMTNDDYMYTHGAIVRS